MCLLLFGKTKGQWRPEALDINTQFGRIYKHTERFKPDIQHHSWAIEGNLIVKPDSNKHWMHIYRLPQRGLSISIRRFGNDEVLGYGLGIMPFIHLPIFRTRRSEFQFRIASGIALLNKHYDVLSNPENNVIASSINNITSLGVRYQLQCSPKLALSTSATFTHYSTGDARLPNLGINIPAISIGGVYYLTKHTPVKPGRTGPAEPYPAVHVLKRLKTSAARFESFRPNGPLYLQVNLEGAIGKYMCRWNKLFVAADIHYNSFAYQFILQQELEPVSDAFKKALGSSIMLEDEFVFGRVSLMLAWAYVLYQPYLKGGSDYQRIGAQYYVIHKKTVKAFLGVYLKTHWANAELVTSGLGLEW
ncbi:hypothetical protein LBMAG25_05530 [Bacteroidota bacterium]|nr:hypothetical protein LBMAG25_05530 [Bacteroidota bacterium]